MPFTFSREEAAWVPMGKCSNGQCRWAYGIRISTQDPERWLQNARRAGYIHPTAEAQLSQYCDQLARSMRAQMQPR